MAQVMPAQARPTQSRALRAKIDHYLAYELQTWRGVPDDAALWPELEPIDREVFHLQWRGITESYLRHLEEWAAQGRLTPAQRARYDELQALIAAYRPVIERLLKE